MGIITSFLQYQGIKFYLGKSLLSYFPENSSSCLRASRTLLKSTEDTLIKFWIEIVQLSFDKSTVRASTVIQGYENFNFCSFFLDPFLGFPFGKSLTNSHSKWHRITTFIPDDLIESRLKLLDLELERFGDFKVEKSIFLKFIFSLFGQVSNRSCSW